LSRPDIDKYDKTPAEISLADEEAKKGTKNATECSVQTVTEFLETSWYKHASKTLMVPAFDIPCVEKDGQLMWKATAKTLARARLHVKVLMIAQAGDCVIYSQQIGHKTVIRADGRAGNSGNDS
jgi:hypothetical protein